MPHPLIGPFIFRDLVYLYQLVDPGQVSMCMAHTALQELQAVAMMLCGMTFHLSGKVVALHLDNSTAKAYLCNQGGTVSPFLFRLGCWILRLTDKHGITLIPAYIPTHLNVEVNYPVLGLDASGVASSPSGGSGSILPLVSSRGRPTGIFSFHSMPALLHLGISTTSGGLGVECPQTSLDVSGKLCVSFSCISSSCCVQVSGRTCHRWTQTFDSGGTMLDVGSMAPHSSQHVDRCSLVVPIMKYLIMDVSVGQVLKGLPYLNLTLWLLSDVLCRQGFSSSVC